MKRDVQGKFALKNEDYRKVRSLRLTDTTWQALGIASECLGLTRSDYLEQIIRDNTLPCITRQSENTFPCNTRLKMDKQPCNTPKEEEIEMLLEEIRNLSQENAALIEQAKIKFPQVVDLEALRDRILFDLKLGKQAPGYKAAQKALNRFITKLIHPDRGVF
ncbi:MAG: hypothetical protein KME31_16795 [Tolypothrix carrinoi HA7290-LM1]|jgi:hypothetical protein|nr:hypothetical protein [Tolypothrix carrinoi HA7290-LM1]